MPERPLNWESFEELTGDPSNNFEWLCKDLIRRHYERFGILHSQAQQEGVEFHLDLQTECSIGEPNQYIGWQCKWYDRERGESLTNNQREDIIDSIEKTEEYFPEVDVWILWTQNPLTKGDQEDWFYDIDTSMELRLWTEDEIDEHLSGPGEILRASYFGELALTPRDLKEIHEYQVAPVKKRWKPELHERVEVERELRKMLGEVSYWEELLDEIVEGLAKDITYLDCSWESLRESTKEKLNNLKTAAINVQDIKGNLIQTLEEEFVGSIEVLDSYQIPNLESIAKLKRHLRSINHSAALGVTNLIKDLRELQDLINEIEDYKQKSLVAIKAKAGCGKTQLAAQLTDEQKNRPAGIFLHGINLSAGDNLDDLASRVDVRGTPVESFKRLISAVDATGKREGSRLPIIIDGLNEAEDPRDWAQLLSSLKTDLEDFSHVLVICTLRPDFVDQTIPDEVDIREIPDFGDKTDSAIQKYFKHYKINLKDVPIPREFLKHPLTLSLFCEVTNKDRNEQVDVETIPGSITEVFDQFLDQAADRVFELSSTQRKHSRREVFKAIEKVGEMLWYQSERYIKLEDLREELGEQDRPWPDESVVGQLEREGVLSSKSGETAVSKLISVVHDPLAGHIIADYLIQSNDKEALAGIFQHRNTLTGSPSELHPLAGDIFRSLVALLPRKDGFHLWPLLEDPQKSKALKETANLEGEFINDETRETFKELILEQTNNFSEIFDRLRETRRIQSHPLNSNFLDSVLRELGIADRDLMWTEWIRKNRDRITKELQIFIKKWKKEQVELESAKLTIKWTMWILSTTDKKIRNLATHSLYCIGRKHPSDFFKIVVSSLNINDPYISERMLAAAYGICMAKQQPSEHTTFYEETLPNYVNAIYEKMFVYDAPYSTTHILTRDYARNSIDFAIKHTPDKYSDLDQDKITPPFSVGGIREWEEEDDRSKGSYEKGNAPIDLDYKKRLFRLAEDGLGVYNPSSEEEALMRNIFWRIYDLGYSLDKFGEIDKYVSQRRRRERRIKNKLHRDYLVEKYGEKYSWIAFCELVGYKKDQGHINSYPSEARWDGSDIDPSFPEKPLELQIIEEDFLGDRRLNVFNWIDSAEEPEMTNHLSTQEIRGNSGPWILVDGYVSQRDIDNNRGMFSFLRGLIISEGEKDIISQRLEEQDSVGSTLQTVPSILHLFAGEVPWSEAYKGFGKEELNFTIDDDNTDVEELNIQIDPDKEEAMDIVEFSGEIGYPDRATEDFEVLHPALELSGEGFDIERNRKIPAKEIVEHFDLITKPDEYDLYDKEGQKASLYIDFGEFEKEEQKLLYIRKEILEEYLEETDQTLIWIVWGESRLETKETNRAGDNYSTFKAVIPYGDIDQI
mgnify:CR=1 FL=1